MSVLKTSRHLPVAVLAMALLAATVIAVGGWHLSAERRIERIARDRAELDGFADALHDELRRLENRYSGHLAGLAEAAADLAVSNLELRERAGAVWGVRQVSLLRHGSRARFHLSIDDAASEAAQSDLPVVEFPQGQPPPARAVWWLDPQVVAGDDGTGSGWLMGSDAGDANAAGLLLYWQTAGERRGAGGDVLVVMVEATEVATRMQAWLRDWQLGEFDGVVSAGGPDRVLGPTDTLAIAGEIPSTPADQVQALRTRFGEWLIQSWDLRRVVVHRDERVVKVALALAMSVFLAGGVAYFALRQALRAALQRVSFVNQVSHELRTPLTNILLNADLAAEGASAGAQKRLGLVREEAERLRRLIDNVLTFSKMRRDEGGNANGGETDSCEICSVVEDLLQQFSRSLEIRGVAVVFTAGEQLIMAAANRDVVAQIVGNLISNAEKYAASGGLLKVEMDTDGGEVVVRVADRGPGIPASQRERIFEAFQRIGDRVSEGNSGAGLGLSIARELAEGSGGSLRLVMMGGAGRGATFELRLPLADNATGTVIDFPKSQAS